MEGVSGPAFGGAIKSGVAVFEAIRILEGPEVTSGEIFFERYSAEVEVVRDLLRESMSKSGSAGSSSARVLLFEAVVFVCSTVLNFLIPLPVGLKKKRDADRSFMLAGNMGTDGF